ncbi:MAG TPA: hypothetical protein PLV68_20145, partial [Ilumatobacteraceae bacterium]|nr:hypothetical protein [Ilumatobacteraceae bacterium]
KNGDISDTVVIKALAVLVWIAWVRLAISTIVELVARGRGANAPRVVGLGATQRWAAGLIAAIVLMAAAPQSALAGSADPSRPIRAALLQADPVRAPMAAPASYEFAIDPLLAAAPRAVRAERPTSATVREHVVVRHDSFWSIAEDEL